jgi:ubiquinone/menaquinone biosynthesis C-methylase UbiE
MRHRSFLKRSGLANVNIDVKTVAGFGDEWARFDQADLPEEEATAMFEGYFAVFPWDDLPAHAVGFDLGCGTGRWARHVAPRVGLLHCIDPSSAIEVARKNLAPFDNVRFSQADAENMPIEDGSMDFGYSLGVLHHIPDSERALSQCVRKLKPGAPFLVYLYYRFDNRPAWFRALWRASDVARQGISRLPHGARYAVSQVIAAGVYWPLARLAAAGQRMGRNTEGWPLGFYRDHSFYTMRTDALDRFGTRLERRFTRKEIQQMMERSGLTDVRFSDAAPFWCAAGVRAR